MAATTDTQDWELSKKNLVQSESRLKQAQALAHVGSWELDFATGEAQCSDEACRIYGFPITESAQSFESFLSFLHPDDLSWVANSIAASQSAMAGTSIDYRIVRRDGGLRYIHAESRFDAGADGVVDSWYGIFQDVTERKLAELELKTAHDQLLFREQVSLLGSIEWNAKFEVISMTKRVEEIFGWSRDEYISNAKAGYSLVYEEDKLWVEKIMKQIVSGEIEKSSSQNRNYTKDGRVIWCEWLTTGIRDKEGKIDKIVSLVQDITDRKEGENRIHDLNERLQVANHDLTTMMNTLPANIAMLDIDAKIVTVNKAWERFAETNSMQYCCSVGENYIAVCEKATGIDEKNGKDMAEGIRKILAGTSQAFSMEYPCHSPDEKRWFRAEVRPLVDGKLTGAVVMHVNITDSILAAHEIRDLNEGLEKRVQQRTYDLSEANKALEAFSYSVSHDLSAPVRSVMGFSKIIRKEYGESMCPEERDLFGYIEDSSKRMNAIIDDLLKLAKYGKDVLHMKPVDMNQLVRSIWTNISRISPHHAELELAGLPIVQADSSMMEQVLMNLLSNAFKYSSKAEEPRVCVACEIKRDKYIFSVRDNGAGFDMKYYDRLFGAFQRLHGVSEFEGTGVGLILVKSIIEKHGGEVWAEGKVDAGATFYFSLPVAKEDR